MVLMDGGFLTGVFPQDPAGLWSQFFSLIRKDQLMPLLLVLVARSFQPLYCHHLNPSSSQDRLPMW